MVAVADVYQEVGRQFSERPRPALPRPAQRRPVGDGHGAAARRSLARASNDERFFDIDFQAMQADPLGEVGRLYEWLGEPVSAGFHAGMKRWWADQRRAPRGGRAPHRARRHGENSAFLSAGSSAAAARSSSTILEL